MPEFTAQIVRLEELFAKRSAIAAPDYQRAFAWTAVEAGQLLEDLASAADESAERGPEDYFLGTMLFIDREPTTPERRRVWQRGGTIRTLDVVDGFQRLTTLTILLCVLRDSSPRPSDRRLAAAIEVAGGADRRARLTLAVPDDAFFAEHVRNADATARPAALGNPSPAEKRILEVRNHFVLAASELEPTHRRRLLDFLFERCCVVQVTTTGIDRAHRMFTVLNATGKPLARNDVLKAALLGDIPAAASPAARALWQEMESGFGEDFERLFSHVHAMHGRPGSRVISGILEIAATFGGARAFIERGLRPAATVFDDIRRARHAGSPHSATIRTYLRYLECQSFSDWVPPVMRWWLERGDDPARLAWFLGAVDRLALGIRILGIGGNKRTRRFGAVVAAIRHGEDLRGPDSPLAFVRQEQRTILHNLRDLHARNPPVAKHLLLRLSDLKAGEAQSLTLPNDLTVEHVLPRKLSPRSEWRAWFPDPEEREQCTEALGNLVLVTKAQNDKASNLAFGRKHEIYFNTPGVPIALVNEDLRSRSVWTGKEIRQRDAELLEQVEEQWNFMASGVPEHFAVPAGNGSSRQRPQA
jgi:Protein of unknown function DUF262/Protein of unknown function (DUF1524)